MAGHTKAPNMDDSSPLFASKNREGGAKSLGSYYRAHACQNQPSKASPQFNASGASKLQDSSLLMKKYQYAMPSGNRQLQSTAEEDYRYNMRESPSTQLASRSSLQPQPQPQSNAKASKHLDSSVSVKECAVMPPWRTPRTNDDWRKYGPLEKQILPVISSRVMSMSPPSGTQGRMSQPPVSLNLQHQNDGAKSSGVIATNSLDMNFTPRSIFITISPPTPRSPLYPLAVSERSPSPRGSLDPPNPNSSLPIPIASGGSSSPRDEKKLLEQHQQSGQEVWANSGSPRHFYQEISPLQGLRNQPPLSSRSDYQAFTFCASQRSTQKFSISSKNSSSSVTSRGRRRSSTTMCRRDHRLRERSPKPLSSKTPPPSWGIECRLKDNTEGKFEGCLSKSGRKALKRKSNRRPRVLGIIKCTEFDDDNNNIINNNASKNTRKAENSIPENQKLCPTNELQRVVVGCEDRSRFVEDHHQDGVVLSWEKLTVITKRKKRQRKILLDNLSGQVAGGFTAILGPTGSGKTALLNTLACQIEGKTATIVGDLRLNGRKYTHADLKKLAGYVTRDDVLNENLTVEETLKYTTKLRLEPTLRDSEMSQRVEDIIREMGLGHVRNTVIGPAKRSGISGGERKRVHLGMELLTQPQLLFLDEPTSGFDSVTSLSLCSQLRELADKGNCTIICTIHQPQSKIFNLFQHLIILNAGKMVYHGKASEVLKFFEDSGFSCPKYANPADHILEVITPLIHKPDDSLEDVDQVLRQNAKPQQVDIHRGSEQPPQKDRKHRPWHQQFLVLLHRCCKEQLRKRNIFFTQVVQSVVMALLIGGVFFQIGTSQASTIKRQPVLFFCVVNQGVFGALKVVNSFPGERAVMLRERAAGMYYCSAYFMAKVTVEMVVQMVRPIVFSGVAYWMVGFQPLRGKFFIFTGFMVLCQLCATSLGLMTSALCRTTDLSLTVLPTVLELNRLFGGFLLSPKNLPKYFVWLDALSYVKYTYIGVSLNELEGLQITCLPTELVNGVCQAPSGQQTISDLGLSYLKPGDCALIIILFILVTQVVAYLGIRFLKH